MSRTSRITRPAKISPIQGADAFLYKGSYSGDRAALGDATVRRAPRELRAGSASRGRGLAAAEEHDDEPARTAVRRRKERDCGLRPGARSRTRAGDGRARCRETCLRVAGARTRA